MMGQKTVQPKLYYSFSLEDRVPRNHLVRRLAAAVDFSFVYGLVRRYYSHTGQPSVDPVVLFKLSLLGYLSNIVSERRLCEEADLNLAWRWFLGYELDEPIPDHSVLTKARRRFGTETYERFFRHIVELCEQRGLVQGEVLYMDSTLSDANASQDSLRSRALVGQRLQDPAQFVRDLQVANDPPPEPEPPRAKESRGAKPGRKPGPSWRRSLVSTTDPDAELATRRNGRQGLAYKTQLTVDGGKAGVITAVDVGAAGDSDASAVGRMLDKHRLNVGRAPRELVGDSGYGSDGAVRECLSRAVLPTLKMRSKARGATVQFSPEHFTYLAQRDVLICPANQELHRFKENFIFGKAIYRPAQQGVCASCPLKAQCTPGDSDRTVQRSWDASLLEEARAHLSSRRSRQRFRCRQIVSERTFADLKCKHGFDRAQFRGRPSVQIQALLTAATVNLKLLLKRGPEAQSAWANPTLEAASTLIDRLQTVLAALLGTTCRRQPSSA
jgi:transposase